VLLDFTLLLSLQPILVLVLSIVLQVSEKKITKFVYKKELFNQIFYQSPLIMMVTSLKN